jgi:hypothetical protein
MIRSLVCGSLVFPGILSELLAADGKRPDRGPLAPRDPHFPAKAKRVIFLFLSGGVSHLDTFDPKPKLAADHGKPLEYRKEGKKTPLVRPQWEFKPRGKSGIAVSELLPHLAGCADDLCVIRSMKTDVGDHFQDTLGMHTGSWSVPRPSLGAWASYGLGTVNRNLPSFVVLAPHLPYASEQVWAADFLPGDHQGARVVPGREPVPNLKPRGPVPELQAKELGLLEAFNRRHLNLRDGDPALAARLQSFETAFGMQREAPEAFDVTKESDATHKLYGLARGQATGFGWQCLVARRLAERGVRFIELIDTGASNNWDSHGDMGAHVPLARNVDQPVAALITDLKRTGLLKDTLVVGATEFGRTPNRDDTAAEGATGRGHQATAFTCWLAGGGVRAGHVHGATDEYGKYVAEEPVHVHDFHATILHLLGFDHEKLTYHHAGRDFRLTDVKGNVVKKVLA